MWLSKSVVRSCSFRPWGTMTKKSSDPIVRPKPCASVQSAGSLHSMKAYQEQSVDDRVDHPDRTTHDVLRCQLQGRNHWMTSTRRSLRACVLLTNCEPREDENHASRRDGTETEKLARYGPKSSGHERHEDGDSDPVYLIFSGRPTQGTT